MFDHWFFMWLLLAMVVTIGHVPFVEKSMKFSGGTWTEVVIGLVLLGLCIAMFAFGAELLRQIQ
jgi:hypothetical protein